MKAEDNDFMTQVDAGTPMGEYLRSHWVPLRRSAGVEAGGKPVRVRMFGDNYVAFRAEDGRVGLVDEACPHRGASLALGRVEGCALRCLFHGWEVDVSGTFVHAVSEANGKEKGPNLPLRPYPVKEAAGLIWAYLGKSDETPRFPDMEWTRDETNPVPHGAIVQCNWIQAAEGTIDPIHVGYLHPNWIPAFAVEMMQKASIEYEIVETSYGFTGAATRTLPGAGMPAITRVKEYVLPYYSHVPFEPLQPRTVVFVTPIDRVTSYVWYLDYDAPEPRPAGVDDGTTGIFGLNGQPEGVSNYQYAIDARLDHYPNDDNFRDTMPYNPDTLWDQDREAMASGNHYTGLPGLTLEDVAVMESQGPIVDRTNERLTKGDILIVTMRRQLIERAKLLASGIPRDDSDVDYGKIRSVMGFVMEGQNWRDCPRYIWELPDMDAPLIPAE